MKKKHIYFAQVSFFFLGAGIALWGINYSATFISYFNEISNALFSGFITISSFLFSLKVFIIFKMKDCVYDSYEYRKSYINKIKEHGLYFQLRNLLSFLLSSVAISFISSIVILLYILTRYVFIIPLGVGLIISTFFTLAVAWYILKSNLEVYFELIDTKNPPLDDGGAWKK